MKKQFLVLVVAVAATVSCKRNVDNFAPRGANAGPNPDGLPESVLPLVIDGDKTLTSDTLWVLDGKTYVKNGVLTIDEGTRIEGVKKSTNDSASALIITRSAQIDAQGSSSNPVIFTSHQATPAVGDWGGVVILGSAPINKADTSIEGINLPSVPAGVDIKYGGGAANVGDENDNSGTLRFVRIEYAGAAIAPNNELNGLTLGGVGRGTTLDHIESALGADDAFEFFGGTVDAKYLIAYSQNDDAFDFDFGYRGRIQFAVHVRREAEVFADGNGMESDNDGQSSSALPNTQAQISNMTVLGLKDASTASGKGGILNAARLRRNTNFLIHNSVFAGFPNGIAFDAGGTPGTPSYAGNFAYNTVQGYNSITTTISLPANNDGFLASDANNILSLIDPFSQSAPDFRPTASSALVTASTYFGDFSNADGFFDTGATFRGAFAATGFNSTWDRGGWAKYNY